jgi:DNA mismatch endonuclease (patch repair protein)
MRKIGPRNSRQEIFIRNIIPSLGYKFKLYDKDLPGKPDLVFPKYNKVIFVNGCFWHGHNKCTRAKLPKTNYKFWRNKITGNIEKDKRDYHSLKKIGWKYLVIWQCIIKSTNKGLLKTKIKNFLK